MNTLEYTISGCVLVNSIKQYLSINVDFICLYNNLEEKSVNILKQYYDIVDQVDKIEFQTYKQRNRYSQLYLWLDSCFTKFHVFKYTQYEKILFTDVDMLCFGDISQIFTLDTPAGVLISKQKAGYQSGLKLSKQLVYDALKYAYGLSAACFLISPKEQDFNNIMQQCINISNKRKNLSLTSQDFGYYDQQRQYFNAGPDEQILAYFYWNKDNNNTYWTNISRQYCCVSWLQNQFESGQFKEIELQNAQQQSKEELNQLSLKIDYQNNQNNQKAHRRKIFIVHYPTDKPWNKDKNTQKYWPDCKYWFENLEKCDENLQKVAKELFGDWKTFDFMSQQDADNIYQQQQNKVKFKQQLKN